MAENGAKTYLRFFSVGDLIAIATSLLAFGAVYGALNSKVEAQASDIAALNVAINQPIENAKKIAVLESSVIIAERDRRELKVDLVKQLDALEDRMKILEKQNIEILSRLPPRDR